jgi:hypothetical protein
MEVQDASNASPRPTMRAGMGSSVLLGEPRSEIMSVVARRNGGSAVVLPGMRIVRGCTAVALLDMLLVCF